MIQAREKELVNKLPNDFLEALGVELSQVDLDESLAADYSEENKLDTSDLSAVIDKGHTPAKMTGDFENN